MDIILTMQNASSAFVQEATSLLEKFPWGPEQKWRVLKVDVPPGVDGRARLLNAGIAESTGRYLSFLDDDDVMFPHAYSLLIGQFNIESGVHLSAGRCQKSFCDPDRDGIYFVDKKRDEFSWGKSKSDLWRDNFIPIHSYVVDMKSTKKSIKFRDAAVPLEDYDFLMNFLLGHDFRMIISEEIVCEYRIHSSNTIWLSGQPIETSQSEKLRKAREFIDATKAKIRSKTGLSAGGAVDPSLTPAIPEVADSTMVRPDSERYLYRKAAQFYATLENPGWAQRFLVFVYLKLKKWSILR